MKDLLLAAVMDENALVAAFGEVLRQEEDALVEGSVMPMLPALIERKTLLAEKLAAAAQQREAQLLALGYPAGHAGMAQALAQDARLAAPWGELLRAAGHARNSNKTNGVLINTRMDYNRRALEALHRAAGHTAVYGPDGRLPTYGR